MKKIYKTKKIGMERREKYLINTLNITILCISVNQPSISNLSWFYANITRKYITVFVSLLGLQYHLKLKIV